jgi:SIR2-like domain
MLHTPKSPDELSQEDNQAISRIAENIRNGDCVLFLGAGVNACSTTYDDCYKPDERPPTGSQLTDILKEEIRQKYGHEFKDENNKEENNLTLSRVAQYYEILGGDRFPLARTLKTHIYEGKTPSPLLYDLAEMPFELIITTNYDQLFENALTKTVINNGNGIAYKAPHIGIYHSDRFKKTDNVEISKISKNTPFLYKIHGDILVDNQSFVITDEDYIQFILRMSDKDDYNPIPHVFADALSRKSILFIGYRIMDYNLRLLFKTIRWGKDPNSMPLNYSIDPSPDKLIKPMFATNYKTNFIVLDSWKIIPALYEAVFK